MRGTQTGMSPNRLNTNLSADTAWLCCAPVQNCLRIARPNDGVFKMDEAHEDKDGFVSSQGNASKALEPVAEALDLMVTLVETPVDRRLF